MWGTLGKRMQMAAEHRCCVILMLEPRAALPAAIYRKGYLNCKLLFDSASLHYLTALLSSERTIPADLLLLRPMFNTVSRTICLFSACRDHASHAACLHACKSKHAHARTLPKTMHSIMMTCTADTHAHAHAQRMSHLLASLLTYCHEPISNACHSFSGWHAAPTYCRDMHNASE